MPTKGTVETDEQKADRRRTTREAAAALIEDIGYIREMTVGSPSAADIRRVSGLLRRLFVDDDLIRLASPRVGKIRISAPDLSPAYHSKHPFMFFMAGGAKGLGGSFPTITVFDMTPPPFGHKKIEAPDIDAEARIDLDVSNYLHQRVISEGGEWATRRDALKYIANVASGVHSGVSRSKGEALLSRIRRSHSFTIGADQGLRIDLFVNGLDSDETKFVYKKDSVDPVLIEILSNATYLVNSPDVIALEKYIAVELEDS